MKQICSLKKKTDRLQYFANTFEPAHTQRKPMKFRKNLYGIFDKRLLLYVLTVGSPVLHVKEILWREWYLLRIEVYHLCKCWLVV
jgi:hypothetical protein